MIYNGNDINDINHMKLSTFSVLAAGMYRNIIKSADLGLSMISEKGFFCEIYEFHIE